MDKIKLLKALLCDDEACVTVEPFSVGSKVFIRCVTHFLTGRIKEYKGQFILLDDAAWIADTGRYMNAIKEGKLNEVEPYFVPVAVNMGSIVDMCLWEHPLPREQK